MIRLASLRGLATFFLIFALSSCGDAKRVIEPRSTSTISRPGAAARSDFLALPDGHVVKSQAVVVLKHGLGLSDFLTRHGLTQVVVVRIDQTDYVLVERPNTLAPELVGMLKALEDEVESADFNYGLEAPEYTIEGGGQPMSFDDQGSDLSSSTYASQWQLGRTHLPEALSFTNAYGTKVAILDTGVDRTHPGFVGVKMSMGRDWSRLPPGDIASETRNGLDDDGDLVFDEAYGHGTHVTGIVKLTAPGATLIPIRVLNDDGWGTAMGLIGAISDAITKGAGVINMSLGLTEDVSYVRSAVASAVSHGIAVVASAGNKPTGGDQYPASYPGVISVTAVDGSDFLAPFASRGTRVSMSAPGVGIISLYAQANGHASLYARGSGTSMAAPIVTGGVALAMAYLGSGGQTAAQMVVDTSTPIDDLNPTVSGLIGHGRIDFLAAIGNPEVNIPDWQPLPSPSPSPGAYPTIQPRP